MVTSRAAMATKMLVWAPGGAVLDRYDLARGTIVPLQQPPTHKSKIKNTLRRQGLWGRGRGAWVHYLGRMRARRKKSCHHAVAWLNRT